MLLSVFASF